MSDKARAASLNERQDYQDSDIGGIDRVVPNSVRDSIEKTISTMAGEGNEDAERYSKALNEKRERAKELRGEVSDDDSSDDSDPDVDTGEIDAVDSDNQTRQETSSNQLPDFVQSDKALAREWGKLKPNVQREITNIVNRKKEVEAQTQHFQHYKELDNAVDAGLREQGIFNIDQLQAVPDPTTGQLVKPTKASVVSSLLFWVGALGHPDIRTRTNALAALANRYGIDLRQVSQGDQYNRDAQYNDASLHINPNSVNANIQSGIAQEFQRYQQQQQYQHEVQQAEVKSKPRIENWAKQKPHFEKVRAKMSQLLIGMLQSGAIDKNADISSPKYLDLAYNNAIKLDPVLAAEVNKERKKQLGRRENPNKFKNTNNTVRGALKAAFEDAKNRE